LARYENFGILITNQNKTELIMGKKALLMILDGWGIGNHSKADVIYCTPTPYWDYLLKTYPHSQLQASGENVGLPDGQMGNSEVGHLNIGAGRVVYQDLVKINKACADKSILKNPEIVSAFTYAKKSGKAIHFMGLTSNGGVHSSFDHLFALCDIAKEYGLAKDKVLIHCFMDGRDTDPHSGKGFIAQLQEHCDKSTGSIASIIGRYYAMDRDKRWNRIKIAYDQLVSGEGKKASDLQQAMQESYDEDVTDEFIKPIVNTAVDGRIKEGDAIIFFNYRNDRAKEITVVLTQKDMPEEGMHTIKDLQYYCMTPYDASFTGVHILFDKENVQNTLGEYLSSCGKKQLHIAETEKYAHVTFFFNGGREQPYDGEDRILVPSPKVATYDLKPEMSAYEVKDKLVEAIGTQKYDFIVVNYANGDMVGHTGVYSAIEKAVVAVDACVNATVEAAKANDYEVIIIADHGNADNAINSDGTPNTAHSLNPVPCIYVSKNLDAKVADGRLADVAPTILQIMDLPQPKEMTGKKLLTK
jgi:2,3-bisphosphoglycerate-independent phosphoglycerate mutase